MRSAARNATLPQQLCRRRRDDMADFRRVLVLSVSVAIWAGGGQVHAQPTYDPETYPETREPMVITPESSEFLNSCASCHGEYGDCAGFLPQLFRGVNPGDFRRL